LFAETGLPHLGLHPRTVLLDGERVLLGDFGLLPLLYQPAGQLAILLQPRYAAPEEDGGAAGRPAAAFSLAIMYHEMLTEAHPFRGRPDGQPPSLDALPAADQPTIAKALSNDPTNRFTSCRAFIDALTGPPEVARPAAMDVPADASARHDAACDGSESLTRL